MQWVLILILAFIAVIYAMTSSWLCIMGGGRPIIVASIPTSLNRGI
jgi:hypothetical protein